jgi:hypothetical protein
LSPFFLALLLLASLFGIPAAAEGQIAAGQSKHTTPSTALEEQLRAATLDHDSEKLLLLLGQNPAMADVVFSNGHSLLGTVAFIGEVEAVRELLRRGADPNLGSTPPLAEVLYGIDTSTFPRSTHYEVIVALLNAGANYEFAFVSDASFVEGLIMEVCEPEHFSPDHLAAFHHNDVVFAVDKRFLLHLEKIKELARLLMKDPACVSFFTRRITKTRAS